MNCQSCGSHLTDEERTCSNCGTPYAKKTEAYTLTTPSAGAKPPDALYSSNPYSEQSNPYHNSNSNLSTLIAPPPPGASRQGQKRRIIIAGLSLLILILLSVGGLIWLHELSSQGKSLKLKPADAQSFYNQTTRGMPSLNDALSGPDNYGWDNYSEPNTNCAFSGSAYHTQAKPGYFSPCYARATNYSDFIFQAQVTVVHGHSAGIVFRADSTNDKAYQFRISTDGTFILNLFSLDSKGLAHETPLSSGQSSSIIRGANQPNLLSVIAQGTYIYLFVNNKYLDSASDGTYQSGQIGVYTDSDASDVDATFRNVKIWKL